MSKKLKATKRTLLGIIVLSLTTIKPFFADGLNSIAEVVWSAVSIFIEAGIDFLGGIVMGFCGVMLKLVSQAASQNLYGDICKAFNTVFWFSANYLIPLGIIILILGLMWGLVKGLTYGKQGSKDDPITLVKRTIIAGVLIWVTPILIVGTLGKSINTSDKNGRNKVTSISVSTPLIPTLLDGLSNFDTSSGSKELLLTDKKLKLNGDKLEALNKEILENGKSIVGQGPSMDEVKFGSESISSGEAKSNTPKKTKTGKTILETLANSMYADSINTWSSESLLWKILYVIIFIVQPAMIVWNLIQIIWVFVKRVVSLVLTACLAPIALAFYPQQSTSEVTTKWLRMLVGYGLTTILTFAFAKLGAFVYTAAVTIQYTEKKFILTVILNFACLAILGFVREMENYANNLGGNLVGFKSTVGNVVARLAPAWGEKAIRAPWNLTKMGAGFASKIAKGPIKGFYDGAGKPGSLSDKSRKFGEKHAAKKELRSGGRELYANISPKDASEFTKLNKTQPGVPAYVQNNGEFTRLPEGAIPNKKAGYYEDANGNKVSDSLDRFGKLSDVNQGIKDGNIKFDQVSLDGKRVFNNDDFVEGSLKTNQNGITEGTLKDTGEHVGLTGSSPTRTQIQSAENVFTPLSDSSKLVTNNAQRLAYNKELSEGTEFVFANDAKGRTTMYNKTPLSKQEFENLSDFEKKNIREIEIDGVRENYLQVKGTKATEKKILS